LLPGWNAKELFDAYAQFGGFTQAFVLTFMQYIVVGLSLTFPVSLYSLFLAVKSFLAAHRKYQTFAYGIFLLLFSSILLWKSYPLFLQVLRMWFAGG
jgi:hypothetical protein